jgi:peptidoglycan/xylan/chitin deacetylase (PgdA/CDA1 family)
MNIYDNMIIAPFFYIFSLIFLPLSKPKTKAPKVLPQAIVTQVIVPVKPVNPNTKYIYLTFDDGPLFGTSNCIDICLQEEVQASFFQVGMHMARSKFGKFLYNRILQHPEVFEILNHSYTHANGKYLNFYHHPDAALLDFIKAHNSLKLTNNLVRLPGNNAWNTLNHKRTSSLVKPVVLKLDSAGYNVMGWDIEWDFNKQGKPSESGEKMARIIDSSIARNRTLTKNHMVILMHDQMYRTASDSSKLATMIGLLKKNPNYEFRKISQYPGLKNSGH